MEIQINKDILQYKEEILFGFTLRQCIFGVIALALSVAVYFLMPASFGVEGKAYACMFSSIPFVALAFVTYQGMNAEQLLWAWLKSEVLTPKIILYKAINLYDAITSESLQKKKKEIFIYVEQAEHQEK